MEDNRDFPHVGYGQYFKIDESRKTDKKNVFYARCNLCSPRKQSLSIAKDSAHNLKKHITVGIFQFVFSNHCKSTRALFFNYRALIEKKVKKFWKKFTCRN